MTYIYLCLDQNDIVAGIMVTEYQMIHNERILWDVADYTLIGKLYNRNDNTFSDAPVIVDNTCTRLEFRQKFTLNELSAIYEARNTDIVINIFLDDLSVSEFIDMNDPDTQNGLGYLYNSGYITYERMLEILA